MNEPINPNITSYEAAELLGMTHERLINGHIKRGYLDALKLDDDLYLLSSAQVKMYATARESRNSLLPDWYKVRNELKSKNKQHL